MQPSIRLHCRECGKSVVTPTWRCMYVPILSGEEKKKRREESRPNPLHSRGAVAEAGIWLIYGLLSVCNNRRLYPPLIHPAINNRPLRSLHAARTRDHLRPGGWKGNELIRELPRGETLTRSSLFGGMTVFEMSITCPEFRLLTASLISP